MLVIICTIFISGCFSVVPCIDFVFNESNTTFEVQYYCCSHTSVINQVYNSLSLLTRSLLPFTTLLISNIIILVLFYQTQKNRRQMGVKADPGHLISLTRQLIAISLTYLILTSPSAIYNVTVSYIKYLYSSYNDWMGANMLWNAISKNLAFINHSINFFLYCIAGKKFRDEFKDMMNCINICVNHN